MPQIYLYNSLSRKKELFTPIDENHVRMYVCGPTVYDYAHIGNARAVVVYDILFRLLRHVYGAEKILYARNITDVDDKINAAAKAKNISIQKLTEEVTGWFHSDMGNLNALPPNVEPKATEHIAEMTEIIERLLASGNAYISKGHVLFDVSKCDTKDYNYGILSGRIQEEMLAGARIAVESYKKNPGDFVLWKPCDAEDDIS
ncbi:MAG: cysteine--tRNA ligase, partial [Pseudomonadota bacterium]